MGTPRTVCTFLLVLAGCGRCAPAPGSRLTEAADAAADSSASVPSIISHSNRERPALDAEVVRRAYEALLAGRMGEARTLFATFGPPTTVSAEEVMKGLALPAGARRGLLTNSSACVYGEVGDAQCTKLISRVGGSCDGGKLTMSCGQLDLDTEGRIHGAYWRGEAITRGRYLVTYSPAGPAVIRDIDTFNGLMSVTGEVVSDVDDGNRLVMVGETALSKPVVRDGKNVTTRVDASLVDPRSRKISGKCPLQNSVSFYNVPEFAILGGGTHLLVREGDPYSHVSLCGLEPARVLASFATEGGRTWVADRNEQNVFISGVPVPAPKKADLMTPEYTAFYDHIAVELLSGAVQRVRTKETTADVPGRDLVVAADGETVAVGSDANLAFLSTKPFRPVSSLKLEGWFGGDGTSSTNRTPNLFVLPDGLTLLATYRHTEYGTPDGRPSEVCYAWLASLKTRKLITQGTMLTNLYEERASQRSGFVVSSTDAESTVVLVDGAGHVTTRKATGDEGDSPGRKLPPELASMKRHEESRMPTHAGFQGGATVDPAVAVRIAASLCSRGGLFVPRAMCLAEQ
jgi:hypothetical protein